MFITTWRNADDGWEMKRVGVRSTKRPRRPGSAISGAARSRAARGRGRRGRVGLSTMPELAVLDQFRDSLGACL